MGTFSWNSVRQTVGCFAAVVAILSLGTISQASQAVAITPFDNPVFNTTDARQAWIAQAGSASVFADSPAESGGEHAMVVPCNMPSQLDIRCYYDHVFLSAQNYSVYKEFRLRVFVPDPLAVRAITLYFESVPQWKGYYEGTLNTIKGWQTLTFKVPGFTPVGTGAQAPNWEQISRIRLSAWRGSSSAQTNLSVQAFDAFRPSTVALVQDFPSGEYYKTTSALLTEAYVSHEIISVADIEKGDLKSAKMAILPLNAGLSDTALTALENFVGAGGKLIAHHYIDARVQNLLGVQLGAYTSGASGQFAAFQFNDSSIPNLPSVVLQDSRGIIQGSPTGALHSRTIADWNAYAGLAGPPAWIAGDNGLYMSHVLLGDDLATKSKMLLSLLNHYVPEVVGPESASTAIADIPRVGKYADYGESVLGIRANEPQLNIARITRVEEALANTEFLRNEALQAQSDGRYFYSVEYAKQSRQYLRDAYNLSQIAGPVSEFRAVWSHDGAGPYRGDWARSIGLLSNNGFNAVVTNVAGAGFADYASNYLPRSGNFTIYGDQLTSILRAGQSAGVKTHAWILAWAMHGAPDAWASDMSAQGRLMQGVVTNESGMLDVKPVTGPYWLSPCDRRNRDLIKDSILEMAGRYEIDGIHLDYNRTSGTNSAYEPSCRERFVAETGHIVSNWPADVWSGILKSAYDAWKPSVITSFVKEIHDALIPVNEAKLRRGQPRVILSAAVNADPIAGRVGFAQDWPEWISQRSIDVLHPMNYFSGLADFNVALANQSNVIANRVPFYPGIGVSGALRTDEMIARSIATRGDNAGGVVTGGFIHYNFNPDLASTYLPAYGGGLTSNKTAQAADLNLAMSISAGPIVPEKPFSFTLQVTNRGPDKATGVVVNDWLPAGVTMDEVVTSQGGCTLGVNTRCNLGSLANGASAKITYTVRAMAVGDYRNDASVTADGTDPRTADNAASYIKTVVSGADAAKINTCVENLIAIAKNREVELGWSSDPKAARHKVYRSASSGGPYFNIADKNPSGTYVTHLDDEVEIGHTYNYLVREEALVTGAVCQSNRSSASPRSP